MSAPEILEWDSAFWGFGVGRVYEPEDALGFALDNDLRLVSILVDADQPGLIQRAEDCGFRTMDIRVTLARPVNLSMSWAPRLYQPDDLPALVRIARESHGITRFYADPRLPDDRCDDLYESWIRQSCDGWADAVLVAAFGDGPIGYVTVHRDGKDANIGLIAVDSRHRGRGLGKDLVRAALRHVYSELCTEMTVVTQGRNIAALRTFHACGFLTTRTEVWLHKHVGAA